MSTRPEKIAESRKQQSCLCRSVAARFPPILRNEKIKWDEQINIFCCGWDKEDAKHSNPVCSVLLTLFSMTSNSYSWINSTLYFEWAFFNLIRSTSCEGWKKKKTGFCTRCVPLKNYPKCSIFWMMPNPKETMVTHDQRLVQLWKRERWLIKHSHQRYSDRFCSKNLQPVQRCQLP